MPDSHSFVFGGPPSSRRFPRIMGVENDDLMRRVIKRTLEVAGFVHQMFRNGQEALDYWDNHRGAVDILVTEHHLPFIDGLSLVGALQGTGFSGAVIVLSSGIHPRIRSDYESLGVAHFLTKGINSQTLVKTIEQIVTPEKFRKARHV